MILLCFSTAGALLTGAIVAAFIFTVTFMIPSGEFEPDASLA
jgi:hypothetical protein